MTVDETANGNSFYGLPDNANTFHNNETRQRALVRSADGHYPAEKGRVRRETSGHSKLELEWDWIWIWGSGFGTPDTYKMLTTNAMCQKLLILVADCLQGNAEKIL